MLLPDGGLIQCGTTGAHEAERQTIVNHVRITARHPACEDVGMGERFPCKGVNSWDNWQ